MNLKPSQAELARCRVLVVGDVMLDRYWFGAVDRISPEAPVPVVRIENQQDRLGGAANVALNVKTLGAQVTLMSPVGRDETAQSMRALLAQQGVNAVLREDADLQTIIKLRVIGRSQQLIRIDFERPPAKAALEQMTQDFAQQVALHDVVLLSDYNKGALSQVRQLIELAKQAGKPVLVDPKGKDYARYAGASVLTPNRAELIEVAGVWSDEAELTQKAQSLRDTLGLDALLLTRSEEGMSLYDAQGQARVAAQTREVFDVTGAGDTVIATFAVMMALGMPMRDAMSVANRAGGIVVGKFGTAHVSHEELFA